MGMYFSMNSVLMRLSSVTGQNRKQLPADAQRGLDVPVGVVALIDILALELVGKLGVEQVGVGQAASPRIVISSLASLPRA